MFIKVVHNVHPASLLLNFQNKYPACNIKSVYLTSQKTLGSVNNLDIEPLTSSAKLWKHSRPRHLLSSGSASLSRRRPDRNQSRGDDSSIPTSASSLAMSLPKCPSISLSTSRDLGPSARLMARPCWGEVSVWRCQTGTARPCPCPSVDASVPPAHLAEPASPADPVEVSLAVRPAPHVHWQVEVHHDRHLL